MNFNFDINKKTCKIMLVAVIGFICYAFFPFITTKVSFMGQSQSDGQSFFGDIFFGDGLIFLTLIGILCLAAFVGIIATAYLNKTNENLLCCMAGGVAGILSLVFSFIKCASLKDDMMALSGGGNMGGLGNISDMIKIGVGFGQWIGVLALIACAVMAFKLPNDEEQF